MNRCWMIRDPFAAFDPRDTNGFVFFGSVSLIFLAPGLWSVWYLRLDTTWNRDSRIRHDALNAKMHKTARFGS
jgi:hypothetical protein